MKKHFITLFLIVQIVLINTNYSKNSNILVDIEDFTPKTSDIKDPEWEFTDTTPLTAVDISSDGFYIAAIGENGANIYLFNKYSSIPLWNYSIGGWGHSIAISSDGNYIVAGTNDGKLIFFNKDSNIPLWNISSGWIYSLAISENGSYIVAGTGSNNLLLFHYSSSTPLWSFNAGGVVLRVAMSNKGNYISAGDNVGNVYYFNSSSNIPLWTYTLSGINIVACDISSDGGYIAIAGGNPDDTLYFFENTSSTPLWTYTAGDFFRSIKVSFNGSYIVAGSWDKNVYLFNKLSSIPIWEYATNDYLNSVDISSDGSYIAAQSMDDYIYFFKNTNSTPRWMYQTDDTSINGYYAVSMTPNGRRVVSVGRHSLHLFDNYPLSITINSPIFNQSFQASPPSYNISIDGVYDKIWYTINNGLTNILISEFTGTLSKIEWDNISGNISSPVLLQFYANNSWGNFAQDMVLIIKQKQKIPIPEISGYNIIIITGLISIISTIIIRKRFKKNFL